MANIEIRFNCESHTGDYLKVTGDSEEITIMICNKDVERGNVILDKSTAIKFAKTLRTEINKIQD